MTRGPSIWRLLLVLGLTFAGLGAGTNARADGDQVTESAVITYRLDRQHARVLVRARFRWTNQIPSTSFRRYYLEQWGPIGVPTDAKDFRVTGRGVRARRIPTGGSFDNVIVSFPRIYRGQSVSFDASWTLPSRGPESASEVRVSDAYSYLCWSGQPVDSGSITLTMPRSLDAVTRGSAVRTSSSGDGRRLRSRQRRDLGTFYACTDIFDPTRLVRREMTSPGGQVVTVEGWPDDPAWLDEVTTSIAATVADLEAVVGVPLAGGDRILVREVAANALMGYGGEFDLGSGSIRVSEAGASPQLLAHELSHVWFNARSVNANWMWEGLAEWAARETAGSTCAAPGAYPVKGSPRLGTWRILGVQAGLGDQAVVEYQYLAACSIMAELATAMGPDAMRTVLASLLDGHAPYDRLPPLIVLPAPAASTARWAVTRSRPPRTTPVDWRQWLDIMDEVGLVPAGVTDEQSAQRLMQRYGIARRTQLAGRAQARAAFHDLRDLAPAGLTPAIVRRQMDDWAFGDARSTIRLARSIATRLSAWSTGTAGVTGYWAQYEGATTVRALERLARAIEKVPTN